MGRVTQAVDDTQKAMVTYDVPEYLPELQKTELEILNEIVRICDEHQLTYMLIGGTLLGAYRHHGFIPWDDDIDVVMPRSSYTEFCNLCTHGALREQYYFHGHETDPKYWLNFPKVRKRNTLFNEQNIAHLDVPKGIYVDIFPMDDALCVSSAEKRFRTKVIRALNIVIYQKRGLNLPVNGKRKIYTALFAPFSIKTLARWQDRLMQHDNGKGGKFYVSYGGQYDMEKETMPKEVFEPTSLLEFEGQLYRCPANPEYYLRRIYGDDFMQLPPVEKRRTHRPVSISFDVEKDAQKSKID